MTAIVNMTMTIINPTREGIDSRIIAVTAFPNATNAMMLAALCFDRLYSIVAPHHYRRNMTKRKGYVLVLAIWLLSFSLSFISFFDPQINGTKTKGAICTPTFFELVAIAVPLFLTSTFVVIQNIYLYCVVVKITNTCSIGKTDDTSGKVGAGMWRKIKVTKKASTTLLILSGASVTFGILQPVVTTIIQSEDGLVY